MKLNPRQSAFISEFMLDRNATQAAIRAGFSKRSARQIAARLLSNDDISARLQEQCKATEIRLQITRDDVLRGLLTAYQLAKEQSRPREMIASCREISKMMGYHSRQVEKPVLTPDQLAIKKRIEAMSTEELEAIVRGGDWGQAGFRRHPSALPV